MLERNERGSSWTARVSISVLLQELGKESSVANTNEQLTRMSRNSSPGESSEKNSGRVETHVDWSDERYESRT